MKLLTLTFVSLLITFGICENSFKSTTQLIEKVYDESYAEAVCFVNVDSNFLNGFLSTHPSIPAVVFQSNSVNISWIQSERLYGHVSVVVEDAGGDPNEIEVLKELIPHLGVRSFAVVIAESFGRLEEYISYLWDYKFTRSFGIVNDTFYAHFPYGDSKLVEFEVLDPLPDSQKDLNGHVLRTAFKLDVPRSFWYIDKKGVKRLGGFIAAILTAFLEKYNATFVEALKNNNEKLREVVAVAEGKLDVALNPYIPYKGISLSYPVKLSRWSIMVPLRGFLDPNEYFLRPFSLTLWLCIGITVVYIILMNILMNILMGQPANPWHSFTRVYLTMLNMSLDQEYTTAYRFQFIQKIFAFVIVNFYLVFLTSFLTVYIKVKEYDSIQELIDVGFPVMLSQYDWNYTNRNVFPKGFEKILVIREPEEIAKSRYSMSRTSYAYGVGIDAFSFLYSLASRFSKPKFRLLSASLNQAFYAFIWAEHAPLRDVMGDFIIRIADYGLVIKWTHDSVMEGSQIVKKYMDETPESADILFALTFKQLRFAWNCLLAGLTVSFLVFLGEKFGVPWWKSWRASSRLKVN